MTDGPNKLVNTYEEQPDSGYNRHYDYITTEEYNAAEKTLEEKTRWRDLTSHEIVVLRAQAHEAGMRKDLIDHEDRLALIQCLLYTRRLEDRAFRQNRIMREALREAWGDNRNPNIYHVMNTARIALAKVEELDK